jgi:hypothetical protein
VASEDYLNAGAFTDLSYEMRSITKQALREFMLLAIDCARQRLKVEYAQQQHSMLPLVAALIGTNGKLRWSLVRMDRKKQ